MRKVYSLFLAIALSLPLSIGVYADGGATCAEATAATSGSETTQLNMANHTGDMDQWYSYEATRDGMIIISSCGLTDIGTHVAVYLNCESENAVHEIYGNCNGQSKLSFEAATGDVILIRWFNPSGDMKEYSWSLTEEDPTAGEVCNTAIAASSSQPNTCNSLKNISQWFKYTAMTDGKVIVSSCDGTCDFNRLYIYDACDGERIASNYYSCDDLRATASFKGEQGHEYYIEWINKSTSEPFDWTISEGTFAAGETCTLAHQAVSGTNSCSEVVSTEEWFHYTPNENGTITITSCGLTDQDTQLSVYDDCDSEPLYYNDEYCGQQAEITFECVSGTTYYIKWEIHSNAGSSGFDWTLNEVEYSQGGTCTLPLAALLGSDNMADHSALTDQWFTYTATVNGQLVISTCDMTTEDTKIYIYSECGGEILAQNDDECGEASEVKVDCLVGEEFLIRFSKEFTQGSYNWSLSENMDTTDIKETKKGNRVSIFPNPAGNKINIKSDFEITEVRIYSILGELVMKKQLNDDYIDLNLRSGLYIIILKLRDGTDVEKKLMIK